MCCGMGHIEGLVTDIIKEGLRSGYASTPYQGGSYQMAYSMATAYQDTGLEGLTDKTLVSYDISLDANGDVTGYLIEFASPKGLDSRIAPDPKKTGIVLYDAATQEVIEPGSMYSGDVKTLRSSTQEHWVVPQRMIQKEMVRQMFNAPKKESLGTYGAQLAQSSEKAHQGADYTARSDLRNKIKEKRKEIGLTDEQMHHIKQQSDQQNIMYN